MHQQVAGPGDGPPYAKYRHAAVGMGEVEMDQRERPHVVLGADGYTVVALSTGVREPDGLHDRTWTMVQEADFT